MGYLDKIWDFIFNIVPVERWVRAIRNVLSFLSLAFILLILLIVVLVVRGWGFSPEHRFYLVLACLVLILVVLLLGVILALLPGGALYSPYERSLRQGRRYGNEKIPRRKAEIEQVRKESSQPALLKPPEEPILDEPS